MDSLRDKAALMGLGAAIAAAGFWLGTRNARQAAVCCSRNTHGTGHATASDAGQGDPSPVASTPRLGRALGRLEKLMDQREREQAVGWGAWACWLLRAHGLFSAFSVQTKRRHQHAVEAEMALLRRQLRHARQLADKDGSGAPSTQALGRQTSALSTGERVELSPTQVRERQAHHTIVAFYVVLVPRDAPPCRSSSIYARCLPCLILTTAAPSATLRSRTCTLGLESRSRTLRWVLRRVYWVHTCPAQASHRVWAVSALWYAWQAHTALAAMHAVDGEVSFENFVKYWDNAHMAGMFGDRYVRVVRCIVR